MTEELVQYELADGVATIRIDDGKRNALGPPVQAAIYKALDRAERDKAIVILTGRESVFSAGFDLKVLRGAPKPALTMLRGGYRMTARVLAYPYPVFVACNGHSMAMGVFLMLAADHVIGSRGDFKIAANEIAMGLTMPRVAAAMLEHRLAAGAYQRAVTLSAEFDPESALEAGFFDELVDPADLEARARELALASKTLGMEAHRKSKRRIRRKLIRRIRWSIPLDLIDAMLLGLKAAKSR
ncbi:MAG: crotonase/enoyl-CoA hydratase family protein [Pseudomonadota bacterium]